MDGWTHETYAQKLEAEVSALKLQVGELQKERELLMAHINEDQMDLQRVTEDLERWQESNEYDHHKMDEFARELLPDEEGKTWAPGFTLGKLLEMVRDERSKTNRLIESLQNALNGPIRKIAYNVKQGGILGEMLLEEIDKALADGPKCGCTDRAHCSQHPDDTADPPPSKKRISATEVEKGLGADRVTGEEAAELRRKLPPASL